MFTTDADKQTLKATKRLGKIGKWAIPTAVANTLDNMAYTARGTAIKQFEKDHVIRSTWTQRGMRFEKTKRGVTIASMESRVGNIRPYAADLETGATIRPRKQVLMSPTLAARGGRKDRRIKPSARLNRMSNVRRLPNISGHPKRRMAAMLNMARKEGYFGPFLIMPHETRGMSMPVGIFRLAGAGRKRRNGGRIQMIRKIQSTAVIKSHPFVKPAARIAGQSMAKIYIANAERLIAKAR